MTGADMRPGREGRWVGGTYVSARTSDTPPLVPGRTVAGAATFAALAVLVYVVGLGWVVGGVTFVVLLAAGCARLGARRELDRLQDEKKTNRQNRRNNR